MNSIAVDLVLSQFEVPIPCQEGVFSQWICTPVFFPKLMLSEVKVDQLCPTWYDPMDCSPPGSSVHGILQARILEWVAIPFSRESSQPRNRTQVFTFWAERRAKSPCPIIRARCFYSPCCVCPLGFVWGQRYCLILSWEDALYCPPNILCSFPPRSSHLRMVKLI